MRRWPCGKVPVATRLGSAMGQLRPLSRVYKGLWALIALAHRVTSNKAFDNLHAPDILWDLASFGDIFRFFSRSSCLASAFIDWIA